MARLFDFAANQYVDVPDEEVSGLVTRGSHGFAQGQEVDIILPNGQAYKLGGPDAAHAFRLGAQYQSPEQAEKEALRQEYGSGFGNALLAFGAGLGRGVSLGMSDAVLSQAVDPKILQTYREEFGGLSTAGELTGAIAPAFFTGGVGALGTAARLTPSGALAAASTAAGRAASERALRKMAVDGLSRKAGQAATAFAVAGGLEGAVYQAGTELTDKVLLDKPKSANEIMANIGFSGLLGGGLGGFLGGGAVVGIAGTKRTMEASKRLFENVLDMPLVDGFTDVAVRAVSTLTGEAPEKVRPFLTLGKKGVPAKREAIEAIDANKRILDEVRLERLALRAQSVRNKIAGRARSFELEVDVETARLDLAGDIEANLQRKQSILDDLTDEEIDVAITDLELHGVLDKMVEEKGVIKEMSIDRKRQLLSDQMDLLETHTLQKVDEAKELSDLNGKASAFRESLYGIRTRGADGVEQLRAQLADSKSRAKANIAEIKQERAELINNYTEKEIDLGLRQLREQGYLTEEMFDIERMTAKQKHEIAVEKADLMFRKAETEAERAVLFEEIQERVIEDSILKLDLDEQIATTQAAIKQVGEKAKTEADRLIQDADGAMTDITQRGVGALNSVLDLAEDVATKIQRRGVEGATEAKAGFYARMENQIEAPLGGDADMLESVSLRLVGEGEEYFIELDKLMKNDSPDAAFISEQMAQDMNAFIKGMDESYSAAMININNIRRLAKMDKLEPKTIAFETFKVLDTLKRRLQEVQKYGDNIHVKDVRFKSQVVDEQLIKPLEQVLMNPEYFGEKAVQAYAKVNNASSNYYRLRKLFRQKLTTETVKPGVRTPRGMDPDMAEDLGLDALPAQNLVRGVKSGTLGNVFRQIDSNVSSTTEVRKAAEEFLNAADELNIVYRDMLPDDTTKYGEIHKELGEAIASARKSFTDARKAKNTLKAYHMVTGRKVPFSDQSDPIREGLAGYQKNVETLEGLQEVLGNLKNWRRAMGDSTFEQSKRFAAETKTYAAQVRQVMAESQTKSILKLSDLMSQKATVQKQVSDLRREVAENKLDLKKAKTAREKMINGKLAEAQKKLAGIDDQANKLDYTLRKAVRDQLKEERGNLAKAQDDIRSGRTKQRIAEQFRKEQAARVKNEAQQDILALETDLQKIEQRRASIKSQVAWNKKNLKANKSKANAEQKKLDADLEERAQALRNEIKERKHAMKAASYLDDEALDRAKLDLLMREQMAKTALDNMGTGLDGVGASILAGAAGAIPFGATGAIMGATVAAMSKPATFGRATLALWDLADATEKGLQKGADAVVESIFKKSRPTAASKVNLLPTFLGALSGLADMADPVEQDKEFARASQRLTQFATNQQLRTKMLEESTKDLADYPELRAEVQRQQAVIGDALYSYLPKKPGNNAPSIRPRPYDPPDSKKRAFYSLVEVADNYTETMVNGCINNTITQDQCDFSRVAFPENHATFATALSSALAELEPGVMPPEKMSVFKKVLGPMIDPTFGGAFVAVTQGAHAQPQEPAASGGNFNALRGQPGRAILPSQGPLQEGAGSPVIT
tara:strand:+ start:30845 stop:35527 length:4683 start_codon:yes stop_codon:yes gene_type:complete